jgi:hypothetical protein
MSVVWSVFRVAATPSAMVPAVVAAVRVRAAVLASPFVALWCAVVMVTIVSSGYAIEGGAGSGVLFACRRPGSGTAKG